MVLSKDNRVKNLGIVPIFGFIQYVIYKMAIYSLASRIFLHKLSRLLNSIAKTNHTSYAQTIDVLSPLPPKTHKKN